MALWAFGFETVDVILRTELQAPMINTTITQQSLTNV